MSPLPPLLPVFSPLQVGAYGRWPNAATYNAFQKAVGTTTGVKATRMCTVESIRVGTMLTLA